LNLEEPVHARAQALVLALGAREGRLPTLSEILGRGLEALVEKEGLELGKVEQGVAPQSKGRG